MRSEALAEVRKALPVYSYRDEIIAAMRPRPEERVPLYERYGEIVIDCDDATPDEIVETIAAQLS